MKRNIPALVLALALALSLAACGRSEKTAASAQPTAAADKAGNITLCPTYDDGKGGYFSVTLPASWGDDYLTECGANDGGYYVGFYEKTDHDNGLGGFLFMLEVFPTDYDYTELPEYQAICGLTVDGANYIYADVWASMGQESEQKKREEAFKGFCVDSELMSLAAPGVKFLHCLPAHRGEEVTDEVMESEASIVWDEAENRLHAQKAILEWVFSD